MEEIVKIIIFTFIGGFIMGWYCKNFYIPQETIKTSKENEK